MEVTRYGEINSKIIPSRRLCQNASIYQVPLLDKLMHWRVRQRWRIPKDLKFLHPIRSGEVTYPLLPGPFSNFRNGKERIEEEFWRSYPNFSPNSFFGWNTEQGESRKWRARIWWTAKGQVNKLELSRGSYAFPIRTEEVSNIQNHWYPISEMIFIFITSEILSSQTYGDSKRKSKGENLRILWFHYWIFLLV